MRVEENGVGSSKEMEICFKNILDEIIEHVIESICFDAHRAANFGYFTIEEYSLNNRKFETFKELPDTEDAIFDIKEEKVFTICRFCKQSKDATALGRHLLKCRTKSKENSTGDNSGPTENGENIEGSNSYEKTVKRPVKRERKDAATMIPENMLASRMICGVIRPNGQPCKNSLKCTRHLKKDSPLDDNVDNDILD